MPYDIVKRGDEYCLKKATTGEIVNGSCHRDRAETERMGRAIMASEHKAVAVHKGDDGARYMTLVTTNGYKDRENEYISTDALADWVNKQWDGEQFKSDNRLDFWHTDPPIGDLVWADMQGTFLVEVYKERTSGLPLVQHYTRAIWDYVEKQDDYGASHLFLYDPEQVEEAEDGRIYHAINKRRSTTLPLEFAANPYTFSGVVSMTNQQQEKRDGILNQLFGTQGIASTLRNLVGSAQTKLEQEGVEHKAIGPTVTKDDLRDTVLIATKQVIETVVEKKDNAEGVIDLEAIVDTVIDALMTVPTTNVADYADTLAVDPPETDEDDDEEEADAAPNDEIKALVEAVQAYDTVVQENAELLKQITILAESQQATQKSITGLPDAIKKMAARIDKLEKQMAGRSKRASQSAETDADKVAPEIVKEVEALLDAEPVTTHFGYPARKGTKS